MKKYISDGSISQQTQRFFKCYKQDIEYRSENYQNIIVIKAVLSIKGYRSHPVFFDVMEKGGKKYFISVKDAIVSLINL